jgi:hypothetical protein
VFRRMVAGLRHLPRLERQHALKAAREWRRCALNALRDQRAGRRRAREGSGPSRMPVPS